MAGDRVGLNPKMFEEPEHAQAHRPQGRLGHLGRAERDLLLFSLSVGESRVREDEVDQSPAVIQGEAIGFGQGVVDLREPASQAPEHPRVLRSLAGEEHRQAPGHGTGCVEDPFGGAGVSRAVAVLRATRALRSALHQGAGLLQHASQVGLVAFDDEEEPTRGVALEPSPRAGCLDPQGRPGEVAGPGLECVEQAVLARGRDGEDLHVAIPVDLLLFGLRLFEDTVEVAATEAEGAHGRAARMFRTRHPGACLGVDVEGRRPRRGPRDRRGHLRRGGEYLVVQGERGLDQTRSPRRCLGMADL